MFENKPIIAEDVKRPARDNFARGIIAVGILILILSIVAYFRPSRTSGINPPKLNQAMSGFELADLSGKWVKLKDYSGQVVLINAWATWCPPCQLEMPDLNAFYSTYRDQGFAVLAIDVGEPPATAADFARAYNLKFPILVDPDYRVMDGLRINTYPTSILIDRKGIVRDIRVGVHTPATLDAAVLPLLAEGLGN